MENVEIRNKRKSFWIIWAGQFASILGSAISSFGISIWILNHSEDTRTFAITFLFQLLPGIIFAAWAGSLADRHSRKKIMLIADSLDVVLKLLILYFILTDSLSVYIVYPFMFLSATCSVFQGPALDASIPNIVDKEYIPTANGSMQLIMAVQAIVAPITASLLYPIGGLKYLFILDFCTYTIGILTLLSQEIPQSFEENIQEQKGSRLQDLKESYLYLKEKSGFVTMLIAFSFFNFFANLCLTLLGPMVMSIANEQAYGYVNAAGGLGMIAGAALTSIFPAKTEVVRKVARALLVSALGMFIIGIKPLWYIVALGFFVFMVPVPYTNGSLTSLIHRKIPSEKLGRVGAVMNLFLRVTQPLAVVLSYKFADEIFNPLMRIEGPMDGSFIGNLIGVGPHRGVALMIIICGAILGLLCIYLLNNQLVLSMEERLPDVDNTQTEFDSEKDNSLI